MEKQGFFSKLSGHFKGTLIAGGLIFLPVAIVVGLLVWIFLKIEGFVQPALYPVLAVPRQLYLPVGVNQFCRFTSLAWPRCWAALVR